MRDFDAHWRLRDATFLGDFQTAAEFTLYHCGAWPAMVHAGVTSITGELYEIPIKSLRMIDSFEGHPDLFCRQPIKLAGQPADAWVYTAKISPDWQVIPCGCWTNATTGRAHHKRICTA